VGEEDDCLSRAAGADGWRRWFVEDSFFESSEVDLIGVIVARDMSLSMSTDVDGFGATSGAFMTSFADETEFNGGAVKNTEARRSSIGFGGG